MYLGPLNALLVTKYVALLAKILPESTLIYSSEISRIRLYVQGKIVIEAHKDVLMDFFLLFSHILPVIWKW